MQKNEKYKKILNLIDYHIYDNQEEKLKTISIIRKMVLKSLMYSMPLDYALDGMLKEYKILPNFLFERLQSEKEKNSFYEKADEFCVLSVFSDVSDFSRHYKDGIDNTKKDSSYLILKNLELGVPNSSLDAGAVHVFLPYVMANKEAELKAILIDDEDILNEYDTDGLC